jgi:hypothetical protein
MFYNWSIVIGKYYWMSVRVVGQLNTSAFSDSWIRQELVYFTISQLTVLMASAFYVTKGRET